MNHLKMHSLNKIDENVSKIAALFPNCVTEAKAEDGSITKKIDFDMLRQELSRSIVEGREERYQFTWPDKKQAILTANAPINKTLRPCREESVNFDETENLYIEGDNLEVLKLLQETYLGKIKMIYIDPPYNTGNDFVYNDEFSVSSSEFSEKSGNFDQEGNLLVDNYTRNTESNGRFHTDWLNMMYPRLKLARDLLSDDGVIFISIGQNEIDNIIRICNEIYGENNQLGIISRQMKSGGGTQGKYFAHNIDYVVIYAKQYDIARYFRGEMSEELVTKVYNQIETQGPRKGEYYRSMGLYQSSLGVRPSLRYFIQCPDGTFVIPPGTTFPTEIVEGKTIKPDSTDGVWRWSYDLYKSEFEKGNIEFKKSKNGILLDENHKPSEWNIYTKIWLNDRKEEGTIPNDLITKFENRHSSKELLSLSIPFDFAKPVGLIRYLIKIMAQEKNITILDFFSGSATTAHAVMQLNAEDGGNRKFIMVQLPELCDEKSEAYKAGYKNICEIGKERIRRAGQQILKQVQNDKEKSHTDSSLLTQTLFSNEEEKSLDFSNPCDNKKLDIGFRVLKCDTSNMEDVYYSPDHFDKQDLFKNNIKNDRTAEDLLFQVMLDLGIMLSSKIETKQIDGKTVYYVEGNYLVACFDEDVTEETITKIAKETPYYFVMKDSSMANDSVATNFEQIFTTYSPETIRKVL